LHIVSRFGYTECIEVLGILVLKVIHDIAISAIGYASLESCIKMSGELVSGPFELFDYAQSCHIIQIWDVLICSQRARLAVAGIDFEPSHTMLSCSMPIPRRSLRNWSRA
jgi:hypothetical protein